MSKSIVQVYCLTSFLKMIAKCICVPQTLLVLTILLLKLKPLLFTIQSDMKRGGSILEKMNTCVVLLLWFMAVNSVPRL